MRLSKSQTFVITALNIVIIVLVAILFWAPISSSVSGGNSGSGGTDDTDKPTDVEVKPHEKLREASAGAVPEIVRETRLMGNGDESVVAVHFRSGVSYIFGNATVKGLDFDSFGGFLCMVNAAGKIMSFTYFDGAITAVGVVNGGYGVGAGEKLYIVDYDGESRSVADLDGRAVDIFTVVDTDKVAVITQPDSKQFRFVEYNVRNDKYTEGNTTRINSYRELEYFDCYDFGSEYVIAARASTLPRYDSLAFFSFVAGGKPTMHYDTEAVDDPITPYAVMPIMSDEGGYVALCSKNDSAKIVKIGSAFSAYPATDLGFSSSGAKILRDGKNSYACFLREGGATTYVLGDKSNDRIPEFDGISVDCVLTTDTTVAVGTKVENEMSIAKLSGEKLSLDMESARIYGGFKNSDGLTLVLSAVGGDALSAPTAGRDVYVITVKF